MLSPVRTILSQLYNFMCTFKLVLLQYTGEPIITISQYIKTEVLSHLPVKPKLDLFKTKAF